MSIKQPGSVRVEVVNFLGAAGVGRPTRNTQNTGTKTAQNVQGIHLADQSGRPLEPKIYLGRAMGSGSTHPTGVTSEVPPKRPIAQ